MTKNENGFLIHHYKAVGFMSHVAVTLEYDQKTFDLALPLHVPVYRLVEWILSYLNLSTTSGYRYTLAIKSANGIYRISPNTSLGERGVCHGMFLVLIKDDLQLQTESFLQTEGGKKIPIKSRKTILGRNDPNNGIYVDIDISSLAEKPSIISREHAKIEQDENNFYLVDLKSKNGTKLNGQWLTPQQKYLLNDGDVIEFGKSAIKLKFFKQ
ncbi:MULTISPECIES: FHA domain-containing protein [Anaerolinea]|uniref:FHA domain-containing protein n=1 Tax=Anaerolinea thermophila (strain DSM 14523 / JCM 11388 / NBRC 100420 / UNI-1) TaxID=926569 RepID=E8MZT1_ANATU|nr:MULTISPECIES: FHA domain-containing protein [Anaerolinea]BAJ64629.1 hypothetical protein ANT_26030 [Anaerolinea thermophila UNI-1]